MPELHSLTASRAVSLLRAGEISPAELLDAARRRIDAVEARINALPTLCFDRAWRRLAEDPGIIDKPLAGLPIAVKDLLRVAGVRTTFGSTIYSDHVPDHSDILVERLEARGALVVAKSNTPEFGAGASTFNEVFGITRNPWNTACSVAGSSGGSAAALAAGEVWLATGSDQGGSLRTPASFAGVVGLRPSPGRIARGPCSDPFDSLSVEGPMARTVADLAMLLDAMSGPHHADPLAGDRPPGRYVESATGATGPLRLAYSDDLGVTRVDAEVAAICRAAALGLAVEGTTVSSACPDFDGAHEAFQILRAADYATGLGIEYDRHRDRLKEEVIWNIEKGRNLTMGDLARGQMLRSNLVNRMAGFFAEHDALLCPAAIVAPFPAQWRYLERLGDIEFETYIDWISITYAITLTGCPALAVPCGLTAGGLPVGLQVVTAPRREDLALAIGARVENRAGISERLPVDPR